MHRLLPQTDGCCSILNGFCQLTNLCVCNVKLIYQLTKNSDTSFTKLIKDNAIKTIEYTFFRVLFIQVHTTLIAKIIIHTILRTSNLSELTCLHIGSHSYEYGVITNEKNDIISTNTHISIICNTLLFIVMPPK